MSFCIRASLYSIINSTEPDIAPKLFEYFASFSFISAGALINIFISPLDFSVLISPTNYSYIYNMMINLNSLLFQNYLGKINAVNIV